MTQGTSIKVKFISNESLKELEIKTNEFIQSIENMEIVDIKYCTDPQFWSIMVIYNEIQLS